jgi:DNA-binding NtrC family response regulator
VQLTHSSSSTSAGHSPTLPESVSRFRTEWRFGSLYGRSPSMQRLFEKMRHAALHLRIATIEGEPGTGKALTAQTLHHQTLHSLTLQNQALHVSGPILRPAFVACAAARALSSLDALWQEAHGGTLYLSRVHELSAEQQRQWLDIVEHFERRRAENGASAGTHSMPRLLLFGSGEPLRRMTAASAFRADLAHRLTAIRFTLPPLRERREDIALLVEILIDRIRSVHNKAVRGLAPGTIHRLMAHHWPGNVRELETVLSNAALDCVSEWIRPIDLPTLVWSYTAPHTLNAAAPATVSAESGSDPNLDRAILRHITRVLARVNGNKLRAAQLLGISRSTLYRLLESGSIAARQ